MMGAPTGETDDAVVLVCVDCRREIDVCAFCDETACATPLCYRSVTRLLGLAGHPAAVYAWRPNARASS